MLLPTSYKCTHACATYMSIKCWYCCRPLKVSSWMSIYIMYTISCISRVLKESRTQLKVGKAAVIQKSYHDTTWYLSCLASDHRVARHVLIVAYERLQSTSNPALKSARSSKGNPAFSTVSLCYYVKTMYPRRNSRSRVPWWLVRNRETR